MTQSTTSLKSILEASGSAWGAQVLYRHMKNNTYTTSTQVQIINYTMEHLDIKLSPVVDFYDWPTLGDKIIAIMDTWEEAWSIVINEGRFSYMGYNQHLINLSKFML